MASSFTRFLDHTQRRTTFGRLLWTSDHLVPEITTWQHTTLTANSYAPGRIRTHNLSRRAAEDLRLRPRGHWDRQSSRVRRQNLQTFRRNILHPSLGHKNKCPGNIHREKTGIGPLKLQQIATTLHVITSRKTVVFTVKVVKTSNFTEALPICLYTFYKQTLSSAFLLRKVRIASTFRFNFWINH